MAKVHIPPLLRTLTGGEAIVTADGASLRQLIAALERAHPGLAARLQDGDTLAAGVAASIDGTITSQGLLAKIRPDSEVHFLPAFGGG